MARRPDLAGDVGGRSPSLEALARPLIEQLGAVGAECHVDPAGPALYVIGPPDYTVAACRDCRAVALIPSLPVRPILFWTHEGCGRTFRLEPPLAVLSAAHRKP